MGPVLGGVAQKKQEAPRRRVIIFPDGIDLAVAGMNRNKING
jgi:hypothetical protein